MKILNAAIKDTPWIYKPEYNSSAIHFEFVPHSDLCTENHEEGAVSMYAEHADNYVVELQIPTSKLDEVITALQTIKKEIESK